MKNTDNFHDKRMKEKEYIYIPFGEPIVFSNKAPLGNPYSIRKA